MAYRGRGRGRGFGGGGFSFAKQEPFISFPEGVTLPDIKSVTVEENLVRRNLKLQNYWKASPYYLEDPTSKKSQNADIERFSDRNKVNNTIRRDSLSQILEHKRFPVELTEGSKGWQRQTSRKRVRWNPDSEIKKLDVFEKLEQREGQNEKGEKRKEGENEEEDEEVEKEDTEEEPSDGDYDQNVDFDDDEDDFNVEDDGGDEEVY